MTDTELLELRRKVCEILNIAPRITWIASRDGGKSLAMEFDAIWECDKWCREHNGGYVTVQRTKFPSLESNNGLALDALVKWCKENGVRNAELSIRGKDGECCVEFRDGNSVEPHVQVFGETPALAIVKAIIAASAKNNDKG